MMTSVPTPAEAGRQIPPGILIVDDEQDFGRGLARLVAGHFADVQVEAVPGGKAALGILAAHKVHLMITDLRMPEMNGMQLLAEALKLDPISAWWSSAPTAPLKPRWRHCTPGPMISHQTDRAGAAVPGGGQRTRAGSPAGGEQPPPPDPVPAESAERADRRGGGDAQAAADHRRRRPVRLHGADPGRIRYRQGAGGPLDPPDRNQADNAVCGRQLPSIPENLLESELFGYIRGAFTGADRDHRGLFSAADRGTIHLDEIGDISPTVQTKLLRCLQSGEIRPVGASDTQTVDVRVIASTNQDLEACLSTKRFRETCTIASMC